MNSSQPADSTVDTQLNELSLPISERIDLIAALLIEIISEELCETN